MDRGERPLVMSSIPSQRMKPCLVSPHRIFAAGKPAALAALLAADLALPEEPKGSGRSKGGRGGPAHAACLQVHTWLSTPGEPLEDAAAAAAFGAKAAAAFPLRCVVHSEPSALDRLSLWPLASCCCCSRYFNGPEAEAVLQYERFEWPMVEAFGRLSF